MICGAYFVTGKNFLHSNNSLMLTKNSFGNNKKRYQLLNELSVSRPSVLPLHHEGSEEWGAPYITLPPVFMNYRSHHSPVHHHQGTYIVACPSSQCQWPPFGTQQLLYVNTGTITNNTHTITMLKQKSAHRERPTSNILKTHWSLVHKFQNTWDDPISESSSWSQTVVSFHKWFQRPNEHSTSEVNHFFKWHFQQIWQIH